jgi:hypothetical protein
VKPSHIEGSEGDGRHEQGTRTVPNCRVDSFGGGLAPFFR